LSLNGINDIRWPFEQDDPAWSANRWEWQFNGSSGKTGKGAVVVALALHERTLAINTSRFQLPERTPSSRITERAIAGVNALRDTPSGTIRINTPVGAARMVLAPIPVEFVRRFPEMQVDLVTEGRLVDIVAVKPEGLRDINQQQENPAPYRLHS